MKDLKRREFLGKAALGAAAAGAALSLEEKTLLAATAEKKTPRVAKPGIGVPKGKIGNVSMGRLICGGNLINGYAHARDLIYVSDLLRSYYTEEKVLETLEICEENGVDTVVLFSGPSQHIDTFSILKKYWNERGGKIKWLAQIKPDPKDLAASVTEAVDNGAVGAFVLGNVADDWARTGRVDLIAKTVSLIKENGMIAGVAGHNLNVPINCEKEGVDADFYMKTHHPTNYWSSRRPDQTKDVIDNGAADNYWDKDPKKTVEVMKSIDKPWIAYKVLAAGALRPQDGFKHAFENGADFVCVGMYDFQVREDAIIARKVLEGDLKRERPWRA